MVLDPAKLARRALRLSAPALLLLPFPAFAQEAPDLYARIGQHVGANPTLAAGLGKPAPEMAALDWLVGEWDVEATVEAMAGRAPERGTSVVTRLYGGVWLEIRDTYAAGTQDVGYLGFSAATGHWSIVSLDSLGNLNTAMSQSGWQGDQMVVEGDFLILGVRAHLRQTVTKVSADEYRLVNEELVGGTWKRLDNYRYTRKR